MNEADNVEPLVRQLLEAWPECTEIVLVDDNSSDGTAERVRAMDAAYPVRLIVRKKPTLGLSGAVMKGARIARGDILVVMDADLSHPPDEIANLVAPIMEDRADLVIGSRYVPGGTTPDWPAYRRAMSRVAAGLAYPITKVHDSMGGFFAIRRPLLLELAPHATGFKIAFEVIVCGGRGLRVLEVPIAFRDRARGASKMNFRVALLFAFRWFSAASRMLVGGGRNQADAARVSRFMRQSSIASPAKSTSVAKKLFP